MNDGEKKEYLDSLVNTYVVSDSSQDRFIKDLAVRTFKGYLQKADSNALEFGCCDGYMTSILAELVDKLTVIDGSETFINIARKMALKNVTFIHELFENFAPSHKYDYIFATYVLEHIEEPVEFLEICKNLLTDDGLIFIVVPNARAISRQLARHMNLIDSLYELTHNDKNHGHCRVYDRVTLNLDIEKAGLNQISQGGLLFKPLADFQMEAMIDSGILGKDQQEGLYKLGLEYPDFAGSLFSICSK